MHGHLNIKSVNFGLSLGKVFRTWPTQALQLAFASSYQFANIVIIWKKKKNLYIRLNCVEKLQSNYSQNTVKLQSNYSQILSAYNCFIMNRIAKHNFWNLNRCSEKNEIRNALWTSSHKRCGWVCFFKATCDNFQSKNVKNDNIFPFAVAISSSNTRRKLMFSCQRASTRLSYYMQVTK
jgi:hypothetical protein